MLTLRSEQQTRQGITRRDLLRIGALGWGGLSLPSLLAVKSHANTLPEAVRNKSVVFLFLQGGPTHVETFDPKMTAPVEYRAMFGEVPTNVPGFTIGSHFTRLAGMADRFTVVRSFGHGNSSHGPASELVSTGGNPSKANLGSVYARLAGNNHPRTGMPSNALLFPASVGSEYKELYRNQDRIGGVGSLGGAFTPFDPSSGSQITENMVLKVAQDRFDDRRGLLSELDNLRRRVDSADALSGLDDIRRQAYDVILGGAADAFDLSKEDPRTLAMYDTSEHEIPAAVLKKKRDTTGRFSPIALGKQMLLARRLCEAGCRYITVSSSGWDMHGNAFGINDGMPCLGSAVDHAVSAFITDLAQRGLSDDVLLVVTGEFGRTPRINVKAGRDHWGSLCPLLLSGGGLRMGQVIGSSDSRAQVPATDPVGPSHLTGTIMQTLFDPGLLRLVPGLPSDLVRTVDSTNPIPGLA